MAVQLRGLDQSHDRRSTLTTAQRSCEQPVGAAQRPGPDLVFHPVVVDGHSAIVQLARQRCPPFQAVIQVFGCAGAIRQFLSVKGSTLERRHQKPSTFQKQATCQGQPMIRHNLSNPARACTTCSYPRTLTVNDCAVGKPVSLSRLPPSSDLIVSYTTYLQNVSAFNHKDRPISSFMISLVPP